MAPDFSSGPTNFKSYLTALVVVHHTAASYGGDGAVPYQSSSHPRGSSVALIGLNALNQSYFTGSFFYISAYYSRKSLQRKGRAAFVRDRLYRLGLPTVAYSLLGPPVCSSILRLANGHRPLLSEFTAHWRTIRGIRGPVWFTGTLLLFNLIHAAIPREFSGKQPKLKGREDAQPRQSSGAYQALALTASAALSFATRLYYPVGTSFGPLALQIGYLPQYVLEYACGASADAVTDALPSTAFGALLFAVSAASGSFLATQLLNQPQQALQDFKGGWNRPAAAYAVWNDATGYALASALIVLFSRFARNPHDWIGRNAFPAFLIHIPVSLAVEAAAEPWHASGVAKTAVVGSANVVASWIVGACLSSVWGAAKCSRR